MAFGVGQCLESCWFPRLRKTILKPAALLIPEDPGHIGGQRGNSRKSQNGNSLSMIGQIRDDLGFLAQERKYDHLKKDLME